MRQYITSDLHFSHKNIIKYCPDSRGHLNSVEDMNMEIVTKHNSVVSEEDHTFIVGDIGFGSPEQTMDFLKQMNGTKTIIYGNHDRKLIKSSIFNDPSQRRLAGITDSDYYKVINVKVDDTNYGVVLFHFKISGWDGMHHGSIHLHGHEHGSGKGHPGRCKDIGADTNNLYPYDLEKLVQELSKKPMTYDGHHDGSR